MATLTLIFILSIIILLSGVVLVLLLSNQRELLDKDKTLVHEIRENVKLREECQQALKQLDQDAMAG